MSRPIWIGVALTIAWLATLGYLTELDLAALRSLELNNLGDFLAGAVAPLAFLWLVVTVFQQHRELKLNTEALKLQAKELKHQVEETRALVQHTGRQATVAEESLEQQREAARPQLSLDFGSKQGDSVILALRARAASAFQIEVTGSFLPVRIEELKAGSNTALPVIDVRMQPPDIEIVVRYDDRLANRYRSTFLYNVEKRVADHRYEVEG
jgi:multidrug efflux pump subunit AcrA (membrane-fusion protein)